LKFAPQPKIAKKTSKTFLGFQGHSRSLLKCAPQPKIAENSVQLSQVYLMWYKNFPIENALRGQKLGQNRGRGHRIFTPNKLSFTLRAPD